MLKKPKRQRKLQDFGPPCEMLHKETSRITEAAILWPTPSFFYRIAMVEGFFFFREDGQSYLVVRKVLHIEQTNTVSLWASGAKDSEKEREQCVKQSSIKHSLLNSLVTLIPVAPILDLNTL